MGALQFFSADDIIKRGSIKDEDVTKLRAAFFDDGQIDENEADMLFALNDGCPVQDPSWSAFFNEAIVDYVVSQAEPEGYVTIENATWLMDHVSTNGKVRTISGLELLVTTLEQSRWSPPSLAKFCITQVKNAVLDDDSPVRGGNNQNVGEILEGEVELIRRITYAFGGDGNISVTLAEAEVLFEINDAIASAPINPAWTEFFVKAIANTVMASSGYAVPSREEALRSERWLDERDDLSPSAMVSAIVNAGLDGVFKAYREQSSEEKALARLERQRLEIVTNEKITAEEAAWLAERLGRDNQLTEPETALLSYLSKCAGPLHPALNDVIERFGAAA